MVISSGKDEFGRVGFEYDRGCNQKYFSEKLQFRSAKEAFAERRSENSKCSLSEGGLRWSEENRRQNSLSEEGKI